jgi:hypothetical protein
LNAEDAMAAQLIVARSRSGGKSTGKPAQKPDAELEKDKQEEKETAPPAGSGAGPVEDPYGPDWIPVGSMNVTGQNPVTIGHYKTVEELLGSEGVRTLPGGSNTVFATVENLHGLDAPSVQTKLNALPKELTIIIDEDGKLV